MSGDENLVAAAAEREAEICIGLTVSGNTSNIIIHPARYRGRDHQRGYIRAGDDGR